jgi:hypothetical protein
MRWMARLAKAIHAWARMAAGLRSRAACYCAFCGRSHFVAGPFVEGPDEVYICQPCCIAARIKTGASANVTRCSFCGKDNPAVVSLIPSRTNVLICDTCCELSASIFEQELQRRTGTR